MDGREGEEHESIARRNDRERQRDKVKVSAEGVQNEKTGDGENVQKTWRMMSQTAWQK